jgi:MoxR-like ATPase
MEFYRHFRQISGRLAESFRNRTPLVSVGPRNFSITDIAALGVQSKTNLYLIGSRGTGKTLLAEAMWKGVFNEEGLYLRGDINLQLKDLFLKLDLQGKSEDEVYQIAKDKIRFNFTLIDELNRVPGVLQNQFLNIVDGYIEIRGKKYYLGNQEYLLMAATGNPPDKDEGYSGTFSEDLALLDRIPLIINTDEIPLREGDIFSISERDMEKSELSRGDLRKEAVASFRYLKEGGRADQEIGVAGALLKEYLYRLFRYVDISVDQTNKKTVDKAQAKTWREMLRSAPGSHENGSLISDCSDISVRTLQSAGRLGFAMYKIVEIESDLRRRSPEGKGIAPAGMDAFVKSYIAGLKLALSYDSRFMPQDLETESKKTHKEILDAVFDHEIPGMIDPSKFTTAVVMVMEFMDLAKKKNERMMRERINFATEGAKETPLFAIGARIMSEKMNDAIDRHDGESLDDIARRDE